MKKRNAHYILKGEVSGCCMLKAGLAITRRLTPCRHLSSKTHCCLLTSSNSLLSPKAASLSCASEDFLAAPSAFTLLVPASPSKYRAAGSNGGKFKCYFIGDSFSDLLTQMYKLVSPVPCPLVLTVPLCGV